MPRNPKAPPYKSKHVISRSKTTEKHMTTVPKPVIQSSWSSWNIIKSDDNTLIWTPSGYEDILKHLTDAWKISYSEQFKKIKKTEKIMLLVTYDTNQDMIEQLAWSVSAKIIPAEVNKRFSWVYDPDKPEYLINLLTYSLKEDLMEAQFGKDYTDDDEEEFDVLYATVSLDLAKINPTYWASLLKMKEIIETAVSTIIGNV